MKLLKTKTQRFADVVAEIGKPEVYTLWQKPAQDRHLQSEIKNNRVMTILKSEAGSRLAVSIPTLHTSVTRAALADAESR